MRRIAFLIALAGCACMGVRGGRSAEPAEPVAEPVLEEASAPEPAELEPEPELPPPLPAPELPLPVPEPPPPAADLADPLDLLWSHRLEFAPGGEPLVTIGLMDGQREVAFRPRARARVLLRGGGAVEVPAGVRLLVKPRNTTPARLAWAAVIVDRDGAGRPGAVALRDGLAAEGITARVRVTGAVYGIAGRVIDTRREQVAIEGDGSEASARAAVEALRARGHRAAVEQWMVTRPAGTLDLLGPGGAPLGEADAALTVLVDEDAGILVESVEHGLGAARAREDRSYKGRLYVTLDRGGTLAAVHGVPLEELLLGLVPSEMPGGSPLQALEAQAVTARSNVMAQVGVRHLNDPFMLCAEIHCQAYRGDGARTLRTDEAVRATRGEALFGLQDRRLVDGVYSAMCGGHGEDNDAVWGDAPSSSLRGRPDLPPGEAARWEGGLGREASLRAFLEAPVNAYCKVPARRDRFRWERRLDPAKLAEIGERLGVGRVQGLRVLSRGSSGRARVLRVEGERAALEIGPELRIRRALGDLPSAAFVVDRDGDALVLRGGGWGHGVGLCQWGAVGRATAGQTYRDILRAYFSGAEVGKVY